ASTGGYDSETVQDVMLGAVERRFGNSLPTSPEMKPNVQV
ncbi:putative transposase, partial [Pantoea sesami]